MKKYIVKLSEDERAALQKLIAQGEGSARKLAHARILLKADSSQAGPGWSDQQISKAVEGGRATVERVRERFVEEGLEAALKRRPSSTPRLRKLDGEQEARLMVLACSEPEEGREHWTLQMLADKLRGFDCNSVISPALGGIIVGQEVGRSLGKRHIFTEKEEGKLALRRGFKIDNGEKFIVVEDVVTRGGRVQETIDIVRAHRGIVTAVGVIVDRSGKSKPDFGCPFVSLVEMNVENFAADQLPPDLAKIPAVKPGSK